MKLKYFIIAVSMAVCSATTYAQVGIGTTSPVSTLDVRGSASFNTRSVTATTTLTSTDHTIIYSGTAIGTLTLPSAAACAGREIWIKNASTYVVTIATSSSQTIDGNSTWSIPSQYETVLFMSDGTNWIVKQQATPSNGSPDWKQGGNAQTAAKNFGTTSAYDLPVITNNTERMRILSTGNVGIGTTTPGSALDVKGTLRLSGSTSGYVGFMPAAAAGSTTYTLPSADGTNGQYLKTNGSGTLSWATPSATVSSVSNTSSTNTLSTTVNGVSGSGVSIINSNSLNSSTNTLTSTVNGVAATGVSIINSNATSLSGANLTTTVNGVAATALDLSPAITSKAWSLTGNSGTTAGTNFIGTTDNQALVLKAYNVAALRLESNGSATNMTVGNNTNISTSNTPSTIAGGSSNSITNSYSFIGGGQSNSVSGQYSVLDGGYSNTNAGTKAFLGTGQSNTINSGNYSALVGGYSNTISGDNNFIGGGQSNTINSGATYSTIGGGYTNTITGSSSCIPGGTNMKIGTNSFGFSGSSGGVTDLSSTSGIAAFNNVNLYIGNTNSTAQELRMYEPNSSTTYSGTHYSAFKAGTQSANITYTLPTADGSSGNILSTNGSGTLSWVAQGWSLTGNSGTTAGTNFIGTTDNVDVTFKRNATTAGKLGSTSTSFGVSSSAGGSYSTAIGANAAAGAANCVAIGYGASANTNSNCMAIGYNASANNNNNCMAIGYSATTTGQDAIAIGTSVSAGQGETAIGTTSTITTRLNGATGSTSKALVVGNSSGNGNGAYLTIGGTWTNTSDR
ncbi:MAG: beta strand repeat-containing protein, partial [Bacteroidota bacterium]